MKDELEIEVNYKQLLAFRTVGQRYLEVNKNKFSKFLFALKREIDFTENVNDEFNRLNEELKIELAAKDSDGFVKTKDNGEFMYTSEKLKELTVKQNSLLKNVTKVKRYLVKQEEVPSDVSISLWDIFYPFVLPELTEELIEKLNKK